LKNRYCKSSKLSEAKFRLIVKCFALDLTATQTAEMTGISRNSVNLLFSAIRRRIAENSRAASPLSGEFEADESYFGPTRVRGKRGRGAGRKTIAFGLLKRDGSVYVQVIPNVKAQTLQPIIRGHANIESVIHTDGWGGYDGLVDFGYEKHFRVNHGENEFSAGDGNHINGIESFWSFAKARLAKFKGVSMHNFEFHLRETEFRFNHRDANIYRLLLKMLRARSL
jgi:transposase-like protein